jgi:uncharacterized protein YbaA (DUF1428 family)
MTYVDGFVIPVPKSKLGLYLKAARLGKKVWLEHGALDYKETVLEDTVNQLPGLPARKTLFLGMVKAKPTETVVFSYIVYKSKAHRDRVNKKVMADPRIAGMDPAAMPIDPKRMAYAGFKTVVEA